MVETSRSAFKVVVEIDQTGQKTLGPTRCVRFVVFSIGGKVTFGPRSINVRSVDTPFPIPEEPPSSIDGMEYKSCLTAIEIAFLGGAGAS
jgi:hypothetical protein